MWDVTTVNAAHCVIKKANREERLDEKLLECDEVGGDDDGEEGAV
eukprot:CAMPEP_0171344548 /NCGR_PEP_ID=MMETSP0878-20121228/19644_1 /TAXON_ID=67004 /ORGANISM="Thalassiosira weissflogii, Strain CCMP1336" /LENGTH=44 /DNA_ID= /DNA_START= /DNA_END= /DNA_ORIENTATION=